MARPLIQIGNVHQRIIVIAVVLLVSSIFLLLHGRPRDGLAAAFRPRLPPSVLPATYHPPAGAIDLSSPTAPFVSWPLARVCAETTWVTGLAFVCDGNSGGPGNMRNFVLTCVRYAVEAGATSLILPRLRGRSAELKADLFSAQYREFGYMFDEAHFRAGLAAACPRVRVYDRVEDVPGVVDKVARERLPDVEKMVEILSPRGPRFGGTRAGCDVRDPNRYTDQFGMAFRRWLKESAEERGMEEVGERNPRLMRLQWGVIWDWAVVRDGPEFMASFGGLLRFRGDVLDLGEKIIKCIRKEAADVARRTRARTRNAEFFGVHLRTEEDALEEWPSYENQTSAYLAEAEKQGYRGKLAYLASGSETESKRFADRARSSVQLEVRTKFDMLRDRDLEILRGLSWDQQAMVDFVVLLASSYFVGASPSSFSINIALKRHLKAEGLSSRPWRIGGVGDGRSWIVGTYDNYWKDWLFMYDGMWP